MNDVVDKHDTGCKYVQRRNHGCTNLEKNGICVAMFNSTRDVALIIVTHHILTQKYTLTFLLWTFYNGWEKPTPEGFWVKTEEDIEMNGQRLDVVNQK